MVQKYVILQIIENGGGGEVDGANGLVPLCFSLAFSIFQIKKELINSHFLAILEKRNFWNQWQSLINSPKKQAEQEAVKLIGPVSPRFYGF